MVYIQGLAEQTRIFLFALGFGFLLGILYDVFRTIRLIISDSRIFVLIMDLLYFSVCAFLTFCFLLVMDSGKIRLYVALGEMLGWLIYYFSFGVIAMKLTNAAVSFFRRMISALFKPLKRIFGRIIRKMGKISEKSKKIIRKSDKKTKFSLQKHKSIVYNLNSYIKNSVFGNKGNG